MKTLIISAVLTLSCLVSFGQKRNDLMGPAAKNYKPWMDKTKGSELVTKVSVKTIQGPEAKNSKMWQVEPSTVVEVKFIADKPKGLKAKQHKIWED